MSFRWLFGWFEDAPIFNKILICFSVMIISLVALAVYIDRGIIAANQKETQYALNARSLRNDANGMRIDMLTLEVMGQSTPDQIKARLDDIQQITADDKKRLGELKKHFETEYDKEALDLTNELASVTNDYFATRDQEQLPLLSQHAIDQLKDSSMGVQNERFEKMKTLAAALAKRATQISAQRARNAVNEFYCVLGALAALAVAMSFVLGRMIAVPISRLKEVSERMSHGDLDVSIEPVPRHDEVGALMRSFHSMLQSWQQMAAVAKRVNEGDLTVAMTPRGEEDVFAEAFNSLIRNVGMVTSKFKEAVSVVGTASEEILVSVKESAAGATQTATAATQTTAIVEEVRQTSHVASQKAKQVSEGAQKTAQITAVGRKATEEIIEGMNRIREQVDLIAEAMVRLSEKSQSISSIISTVDDLAKQSNLLAVNASIEAARAGELGKGFGVVAQEVKSMAEQSKQSTAQVRSIIAEIQQATNAAAMATELGGKAVDAAMQQSGQAGESIAVLANSVVESAQAAAQIAVSNQQQLAGVDQVATAMASIRDACGEHLVAIRHVEAAANRLTEIGGKLKALVEKYEVWETGADQGLMADSNR